MPHAIDEITLEITNRCNLKCQICNIWKERPLNDLAPNDIERLINTFPRLNAVALTGGEALLHPDIDSIYRLLYKKFLRRELSNIDLATNGASFILAAFLKRHQNHLGPLSASISLDGLSSTHNAQRGVKGAFQRTIQAIRHLKETGVPTSLKFTASAINYQHLPAVVALAKNLQCPLHLKLAETLPAYYHRIPLLLPELNHHDRQALLKSLRSLPQGPHTSDAVGKLAVQRIKKYLNTGKISLPNGCLTPGRTLFVTSRGDIYNCIYQGKIGTLKDGIKNRIAAINTNRGEKGQCPGCLAYHGSLREFNIEHISRNPANIPGNRVHE